MESEKWIRVDELAGHYQVEVSFIHTLGEYGLVKVITVEDAPCLDRDCLEDVERIMRLHHELDINLAGIDAIWHLLERIKSLQTEVRDLKNRLQG